MYAIVKGKRVMASFSQEKTGQVCGRCRPARAEQRSDRTKQTTERDDRQQYLRTQVEEEGRSPVGWALVDSIDRASRREETLLGGEFERLRRPHLVLSNIDDIGSGVGHRLR